jgi:hypothetical protein
MTASSSTLSEGDIDNIIAYTSEEKVVVWLLFQALLLPVLLIKAEYLII